MPRTDVEILDSVIDEWFCGNGGSIAVRAVLWMMSALRKGNGDKTTVEGVNDALSDLTKAANNIRLNVKKEYLKEHPEEDLPFMEENILLVNTFRNFRATLDRLQSRNWWQKDIPFPMQRSFADMWGEFSQAPVISSIDDLSKACYKLKEGIRELGSALSISPNRYTENCVQWMCFQMANTIPDRIFNLCADEASKAEARVTSLQQVNEWMKKIAEGVYRID